MSLKAYGDSQEGTPVSIVPDTIDAFSSGKQLKGTGDIYGGPHLLVADTDLALVPRPDGRDNKIPLLLLVLYLTSIALIRYFFPGHITRTGKAAMGLHAFFSIQKEGGAMHALPGILLKINFLIVVSLLAKQTLLYLDPSLSGEEGRVAWVFGGLFVLFSLFYPVKWLIVMFLAWVFNAREASRYYFENILIINQFSGLVLAPLVFFYAFNPVGHLLYATWIIVLILLLAKMARGMMLKYRTSGFSLYYLFLYLCGIEIAPLLLIGKAATHYLF